MINNYTSLAFKFSKSKRSQTSSIMLVILYAHTVKFRYLDHLTLRPIRY